MEPEMNEGRFRFFFQFLTGGRFVFAGRIYYFEVILWVFSPRYAHDVCPWFQVRKYETSLRFHWLTFQFTSLFSYKLFDANGLIYFSKILKLIRKYKLPQKVFLQCDGVFMWHDIVYYEE